VLLVRDATESLTYVKFFATHGLIKCPSLVPRSLHGNIEDGIIADHRVAVWGAVGQHTLVAEYLTGIRPRLAARIPSRPSRAAYHHLVSIFIYFYFYILIRAGKEALGAGA
jgi:hypothetical protein